MYSLHDLPTVQFGHHDIQHDQVKIAMVCLKNAPCIFSIRGREYMIALPAQNPVQEFADSCLVLGNEDGLSAAGIPGDLRGFGWSTDSPMLGKRT